jgi:hypothetical protein
VGEGDIDAYAAWEMDSFLGPQADVCTKLEPWHIADDQSCDINACSHRYRSYANGWGVGDCDRDSGACSPLVRYNVSFCDERSHQYRDELVAYKRSRVDRQLGGDTMRIVWTVVYVEVIGTLLLVSLQGHADHTDVAAKATMDRWGYIFSPFMVAMYVLPLTNFFDFLRLASHVIKVKFYFCDDDVSDACLISGTETFDKYLSDLKLLCGIIIGLHIVIAAERAIIRLRAKHDAARYITRGFRRWMARAKQRQAARLAEARPTTTLSRSLSPGPSSAPRLVPTVRLIQDGEYGASSSRSCSVVHSVPPSPPASPPHLSSASPAELGVIGLSPGMQLVLQQLREKLKVLATLHLEGCISDSVYEAQQHNIMSAL